MSGRFEDERGVIEDLIGPVDSVTQITTNTEAVRGNHWHLATTQWTYVITGTLLVAHGDDRFLVGPGELCETPPKMPHAWRALSTTVCLVFTRGPRSGEGYESDTFRLEEPLLS